MRRTIPVSTWESAYRDLIFRKNNNLAKNWTHLKTTLSFFDCTNTVSKTEKTPLINNFHIKYIRGVRNVGGRMMEGAQPKRALLRLWDGDGRTLGIVEAVHGVQLHDHVQAVGQHQHHEKTGHQTHPDPGREEACAVAGVRELAAAKIKALYLYRGEKGRSSFHLKHSSQMTAGYKQLMHASKSSFTFLKRGLITLLQENCCAFDAQNTPWDFWLLLNIDFTLVLPQTVILTVD